jgi:acyl-CoA thioester hydrolase
VTTGTLPAPAIVRRSGYPHFLAIPTRWMDNDSYGHVNNVTYYSYFDTVVNEHLVRAAGHDIRQAPAIGIVVETMCRFHRALSFPETIDAGLRVTRIGNSSVHYEIGLFRRGDEAPAATGRFVHVWVDREAQRPMSVPPHIRAVLMPLLVNA